MSERPPSNENSSFLELAEKAIWRDAREFFENFAGEWLSMYERAWGIFFIAQIDDQLTGLVEDFFVDDKKTTKRMLEGTGALTSFGVRIEIAFLLGLISARERGLLNLLRIIRNDLSKNSEITSFSQSPIREICLGLDVQHTWGKGSREAESASVLSEPWNKFIIACEYLTLILAYRRDTLERCSKAEPIAEEIITSAIKTLQDKRS